MVSATSNVDDLGPAAVLGPGIRELASRPFTSWDDALEPVADAALSEPLLRVLDEFPVLEASPELESVLHATWNRAHTTTRCGSCSAVRRSRRWRRSKRSALRSSAASTSRSWPSRSALTRPRSSCHGFPQLSTHGWGLVGGIGALSRLVSAVVQWPWFQYVREVGDSSGRKVLKGGGDLSRTRSRSRRLRRRGRMGSSRRSDSCPGRSRAPAGRCRPGARRPSRVAVGAARSG